MVSPASLARDLGGQGVHPLQVHGLVSEAERSQRRLVPLQHLDPGLDPVRGPPCRSDGVGRVLRVVGEMAPRVANPGLLLVDPGTIARRQRRERGDEIRELHLGQPPHVQHDVIEPGQVAVRARLRRAGERDLMRWHCRRGDFHSAHRIIGGRSHVHPCAVPDRELRTGPVAHRQLPLLGLVRLIAAAGPIWPGQEHRPAIRPG